MCVDRHGIPVVASGVKFGFQYEYGDTYRKWWRRGEQICLYSYSYSCTTVLELQTITRTERCKSQKSYILVLLLARRVFGTFLRFATLCKSISTVSKVSNSPRLYCHENPSQVGRFVAIALLDYSTVRVIVASAMQDKGTNGTEGSTGGMDQPSALRIT